MCGHADENCPVFPGKTKVVHVGFEDPPRLTRDLADGEEKLAVYRRVRDQIQSLCGVIARGVELGNPIFNQERKETMKTKNDIAVEKFLAGYNCAQSVLYAFGPGLGLADETALKLATGLGAGMARRGEACGAVTGGILALGLKYGRGGHQDRSATEETYQKTLELMARFEKRHGSCLCRVLLDGCDLRTAEGQKSFKEKDLLHKTCVGCVRSVVEEVAQLLNAPGGQTSPIKQ